MTGSIPPLRILLCDDHALVREALALLLEQQPGWRVVAQASDGAEAVRLANALKPDLAVLDVAMPGISGIEAAALIRADSPRTRILALSMYCDQHYRRRMFGAGARAYVLKNEASAELVQAIRALLRGEIYVSPALSVVGAPPPHRRADTQQASLTTREREVLQRMAVGQRTRDIATDLGISPKTVETYRGRLMLKLGVTNLAELVRFAIRAGLVSGD